MIDVVRLLLWRSARRHVLRHVLVALAVGAGVALVVAVAVASSSLERAYAAAARDIAGLAPLRVVGPSSRGGLTSDVADRLARLPDVALAVPVVSTATLVRPPRDAGPTRRADVPVLALGVDCRAREILPADIVAALDPRLPGGRPLPGGAPGAPPGGGFADFACGAAAGDALLTSSSLAAAMPGGLLLTNAGELPLGSARALPELDRLNGGRIVVLPLAAAQRAFGRADRVDAVYLRPRTEIDTALIDTLSAAAGPTALVLRSDAPVPGAESPAGLLGLLTLVGAVAAVLALLVVGATVRLALAERGPDLAVAAALGARRRTLIGAALLEAGVVGATGGAVGAAAGVIAARPVVSALSRSAARLTGVGVVLQVPAGVLLAGVGLGVFAGVVAALPAVVTALGRDVELRPAALPEDAPRRPLVLTAAGAVVTAAIGVAVARAAAAGGGVEPWQPRAAVAGVALTMAALLAFGACATPLVARVALAGRSARLPRGVAGLAWRATARVPRRSALATAAAGAAVAGGVVIGGLAAAVPVAAGPAFTALAAGRVAVSALPPDDSGNLEGRLDAPLLERLRDVRGVAGIDRRAHLVGRVADGAAVGIVGIEGTPPGWRVLAGDAPEAVLTRRAALVGAALARELGLRPGSTLRVVTPGGVARIAVGAVWLDAGFGGRVVTLPFPVVEALYGPQPPTDAFLQPATGVAPAEVARDVAAAAPELHVRAPEELVADLTVEAQHQVTPFRVLRWVLLAAAAVAVASSAVLDAARRGGERALLTALGAPPAMGRRLVLVEAAWPAGVAGTLGAVAGLVVLEAARFAAVPVVGIDVPRVLDLPSLVGSAALGAGVAVGSARLGARGAAPSDPLALLEE